MFPRFVSKLYYQLNFSRSDGALPRTENVQFTADGILNKPVVFFIKLGAFSLWSFGPQGAGLGRRPSGRRGSGRRGSVKVDGLGSKWTVQVA